MECPDFEVAAIKNRLPYYWWYQTSLCALFGAFWLFSEAMFDGCDIYGLPRLLLDRLNLTLTVGSEEAARCQAHFLHFPPSFSCHQLGSSPVLLNEIELAVVLGIEVTDMTSSFNELFKSGCENNKRRQQQPRAGHNPRSLMIFSIPLNQPGIVG
ncbi:hypothetical protein CPB84DRAFT_1750893 [Gymnopilus junonius]|uniref:Uncharacterized protein n=1 Tax=Gymnopilus junonius TaxID=109634 RepID=A0A9P5TJ58_GYMJU|nr:hypothetical protein CPB84DRAFT_1750893 [Gymnopilus junonius]